jgi:hypothetical protein|tara:strand:- start:118 stop:780 length:663 start_codon:yes stop_codon:yes gene_type:complete
MKLTYSIQVCNESRELFSLLHLLTRVIDDEDYIDVIVDSNNTTEKVDLVLKHFEDRITVHRRPFDTFSKNCQFHIEVAKGDYVFHIDADELPQESLIKIVKHVIEETGSEIIAVPRINIHPDITESEAEEFGFDINEVGFINWPDYQLRIHKNCDYIKWTDELHTKLTGSEKMSGIKAVPSLAMWHIKSMDKQTSRWKKDETGTYTIASPSNTDLYDLLM